MKKGGREDKMKGTDGEEVGAQREREEEEERRMRKRRGEDGEPLFY